MIFAQCNDIALFRQDFYITEREAQRKEYIAQTPLREAAAQTDEVTCLERLLVRGRTEKSFFFLIKIHDQG